MRLLKKSRSSLQAEFTLILDRIDLYPFRVVGALLVLGILLSIIVMSTHPPSLSSGETDSWWRIALNLAHGHGYSLCLTNYFPFCGPSDQVTAAREPVPVLLFAAVAWLGKDSLWLAEIVEAIIYLAIIVAIYFLTLEWSNPRSAVIASFLWTMYLPALELIPQVSGDLFTALCVTLAILFVLRARTTAKTRDWVIAGICLGLAVISRSATLVIAFVVIVGQIVEAWHQGLNRKEILQPAIIIFDLILLMMAPWLIRNRLSLGRPLLGSS